MRARAFMVLCLAIAASTPAAAATLTGIVHTEQPAKAATVRVWARGAALLADPHLATTPLLERAVAPGKAFALDLGQAAPPLRVEVFAEGHLAASFRIDISEQLALRPLWLPAGKPLRVVVDTPGDGLLLRAEILPLAGRSTDPGRWDAVIAARWVSAGEVEVPAPEEGWVRVTLQDAAGRWGSVSARLPSAPLHVALDSAPVRITALLAGGEPAANAAVADTRAPLGCGVRAGADGVAVVQVEPATRFRIAAVAGTRTAVLDGHGRPPAAAELTLEPAVVSMTWPAGRRLVLGPRWLPAALSGDEAFVGNGNETLLPFLAPGGWLTVWSPGTAPGRTRVSAPGAVLPPRAGAMDVAGSVVDAEGRPLAGVPVWRWLTPDMLEDGRAAAEAFVHAPIPDTVTDSHGRFALPNLAAGTSLLSARATGHPEARWGPGPLDPQHASVVIRLGAGAVLRLRTVDEQKQPLPGLELDMLLRPDPPPVQRAGDLPPRDLSARTGPDGTAVLAGLDAGRATVRITGSGRVTRVLELEIPAAGLALGDVIVEQGVTVEGLVVGPDGDPVPGAEVLVGTGVDAAPAGRSDADGRFALPGQPRSGQIVLSARTDDLLPARPIPVPLPPRGDVRLPVEPAGTLPVRVVRVGSKAAVQGATATLYGRPVGHTDAFSEQTAFADEDGRLTFSHLPADDYALTVRAEGMAAVERRVAVKPGPNPEVGVALEPAISVHGRVVGEDGTGIGDATVRAWDGPNGQFTITPRAETADDGSFVLDGMVPGRWRVQAEGPAGGRVAKELDIGQGEEAVLTLPSLGAVKARVLDPDGRPVPGADVHVRGRSDAHGRTDSDGVAAIDGVATGHATVYASAADLATASTPVEIEADTTAEVEVVLKEGSAVVGFVRGLSPTELDGCRVKVAGRDTRPALDGSFTVAGVEPRRSVAVEARSGGRRRSTTVEVRAGETAGPVELDFSGRPLEGVVRRGGEPAPGVAVLVTARESAETALTDDRGVFSIASFPPVETIDVRVRDNAGVALVSTSRLLPSSRYLEIDLPTARLAGTVVRADTGAPLSGVAIVARPPGTGELVRASGSDGRGAFVVDGVVPGMWTVQASLRGFRAAEKQVEVEATGTSRVELRLEAAGDELAVRVFDARGRTCRDEAVVVLAEDGAGRRFGGELARCDLDGLVTVRGVAPGAYGVLVRAGDQAGLGVATVPGPAPDVVLGPAARVSLEVRGQPWDVVMIHPTTGLRFHETELPRTSPADGRVLHTFFLPAGTWKVIATSPTGEVHTDTVELAPGGNTMRPIL